MSAVPHKVTVQYREVPYLPPQVRITRHYGRGIPREYGVITRRQNAYPNGLTGGAVPMTGDQWAHWCAENIRQCPNGWPDPEILPAEITVH